MNVARVAMGSRESPAATVNGQEFTVPVFKGLMRQTTIAPGRFSPWEGCKENRSQLQNTIWVTFVAE